MMKKNGSSTNLLLLEDLLIRLCEQDKCYEEMYFTHTSREVWEKEIWPPSSPYCNPFDYFARGISELRSEQILPQNHRPDTLNMGGNGVPRQERRDEVMQEVQVPDRSCRRC
jgi:hypothetical protein